MAYVNGMVAAVPTANKDAYFKMCKTMGPIFKRHGAIEAVDCWGADVPDGNVTSISNGSAMQGGRNRRFCLDHLARQGNGRCGHAGRDG